MRVEVDDKSENKKRLTDFKLYKIFIETWRQRIKTILILLNDIHYFNCGIYICVIVTFNQ